MPRFFFHVQFGAMHADKHGIVLPDQLGARKVALEIVSQLVRDAADDLWRGGALQVFAEDEQRRPLFTVAVDLAHALAGGPKGNG